MTVTTKLLAKMCGVSIGSVDRALHDRPGISPKTKERVLRMAEELGYRPYLPARSLVTGKTKTIGIVVFDLLHDFFAQLVTAAINRLTAEGYFAYVSISNLDKIEELACLERMSSLSVDGIIIVPVNRGREYDQFLRRLNRPVVTVGNFVSKSWPHVGVDYEKATYDGVEFLVGRGYRRIVYLCPPLSKLGKENAYAVVNRAAGYRKAMRRFGELEPARIITGKNYLEQIDSLFLEGGVRTAVLCSSDVYALKLLTYCANKGIRVPGDIGIMGFDNIATLQYVHPKLTTIDCSIEEIGRRAAECLMSEFEGKYVSPVLKHMLVAGETT